MYTDPYTHEIVHGWMTPRIDVPNRDDVLRARDGFVDMYQRPVFLIESDPDYWILAASDDPHPPGTEVYDYDPLKYIVYPPAVKNEHYHREVTHRDVRNTELRTELAALIPS